MSLELAILIAAIIVSAGIVYAGWSVGAGLGTLITCAADASHANYRWASHEELEEHRDPDDPRDQELGKTFNEHLPPWPNPSALEVVVWRLHRLGLALDMVASALRPEDRA